MSDDSEIKAALRDLSHGKLSTASVQERVFAALTEARAQGAAGERDRLMSLALGSEADGYAHYDGHVAEWLRTLTEGTTP